MVGLLDVDKYGRLLILCYSFLFWSQCNRSFQVVIVTTAFLSMGLAIGVEVVASNCTSCIMPLLSMAMFMFVSGLWLGLSPWRKGGQHSTFMFSTFREAFWHFAGLS